MLENLKNKINQILRENVDVSLYVEYLKNMSNENPFELGGKKWQFVWAKYPDGRTDIGVYAFGEDLVYNYQSWRKMMNIDKDGENIGASLYDRHFRSDNKNIKKIEEENNTDDYNNSNDTTDLNFTDVNSEEKPDYDNDALIEDKPSGGYDTSFAGKFLGNFEDIDVCLASLKAEFQRTNYFPTIWFVSDHGNYWPIDNDGKEIKQSLNENFERNKEIAKTIIQQLGGFGKLEVMTGAYNFVAIDYGVQFKIKNPKANCIKIVVNGKDLYDVEIGRLRGADYKVLVDEKDVYVENLKELIEKSTGMYLSLFEIKTPAIKKIIENTLTTDVEKEIEDEIEMMMRPDDDGLSYNDQNDIANHWGLDLEDVMGYVQSYLNKRQAKRNNELNYWVKELLSQFNNYNKTGMQIPTWDDFFKEWIKEGFQDENSWASPDDVKEVYLKQTTNPNQLSLFESYVKQFAQDNSHGNNYGLWRYKEKTVDYFEQVLTNFFKNPEYSKLFPEGYNISAFTRFYNKAIQNSLPWAIWEFIESFYFEGRNPVRVASILMEIGLKYKYSVNENKKNSLIENNSTEEKGKWQLGFENTKIFEVTGLYKPQFGREFLQGCRHCNEIVKLNNMHEERQMIGNVYQSLCNCDKCNRYVVFDEHKYSTYKFYMKKVKNIELYESALNFNISIKSLIENQISENERYKKKKNV